VPTTAATEVRRLQEPLGLTVLGTRANRWRIAVHGAEQPMASGAEEFVVAWPTLQVGGRRPSTAAAAAVAGRTRRGPVLAPAFHNRSGIDTLDGRTR
jgi:hypothetical protein